MEMLQMKSNDKDFCLGWKCCDILIMEEDVFQLKFRQQSNTPVIHEVDIITTILQIGNRSPKKSSIHFPKCFPQLATKSTQSFTAKAHFLK